MKWKDNFEAKVEIHMQLVYTYIHRNVYYEKLYGFQDIVPQ